MDDSISISATADDFKKLIEYFNAHPNKWEIIPQKLGNYPVAKSHYILLKAIGIKKKDIKEITLLIVAACFSLGVDIVSNIIIGEDHVRVHIENKNNVTIIQNKIIILQQDSCTIDSLRRLLETN